MTIRLVALLLPILVLWMAPPARAAQSQDGCAGFIDSLPATIATQGVWCLRNNLSTGMTSGSAITIATNNVTIDCNDFKLGGLAGGDGSTAYGIHADGRNNATVRNCNIRGFQMGINLVDGSGHLVEDNRLDSNLVRAIQLYAIGSSVVRGNRVFGTGGWQDDGHRYGILCTVEGDSSCDVIDNAIEGLFSVEGDTNLLRGILVGGVGSRVVGNSVRGMAPTPASSAWGIVSQDGPVFIEGNEISLPTGVAGAHPFACNQAALRGNTSWNATSALPAACLDDGGNLAH